MAINLLDLLRQRVGGPPPGPVPLGWEGAGPSAFPEPPAGNPALGGLLQGPPDLSGISIPNPNGPASIKRKPNLIDLLSGLNPDDVGALMSKDTIKQARQQGLLGAGLSLLAAGGRQPAYQRPNLGQALQGALQAGQGGYAGVLQAAQGLQGERANQALAQARDQLFAKYAPAIQAGGPEAQKALALMSLEATKLGIKDVGGWASQFGQQFAPDKPGVPQWQKDGYPSFEAWQKDKNAGNLPEWQKQGYSSFDDWRKDKNRGSGATGIEMSRLNLAIRQADAQNINQALDDYKGFTPTIRAAADGYRSLKGIAQQARGGNQAASIGLLYAYAKVLDPASAVREGELKTLQMIGSYDRRVANWIEMATKGTLTKDQIDQIEQTADAAIESRKRQNKDYADAARARGKALGVNVEPFLVDPFGDQQAKDAALGGL